MDPDIPIDIKEHCSEIQEYLDAYFDITYGDRTFDSQLKDEMQALRSLMKYPKVFGMR